MNDQILNAVRQVDRTLLLTIGVALFFLGLILLVLVVFLIRFRHTKHPVARDIRGHNWLEAAWIIIPSLIVLVMFYSGWKSYSILQRPPGGAMEVAVTARQWSWTFTYDNKRQSGTLYVPVNKPVRLTIESADVIHSFFAPAFRLKRDAVPGMKTYAWFLPETLGEYEVLCTEYCGTGHSSMLSRIVALPEEAFRAWYEHGTIATSTPGLDTFSRFGCIGCHPLGGRSSAGPDLSKVFGTEVRVTTDSGLKTVIADEAYLRRSILQPGIEVVVGYQAIMPSFADRISEAELTELVGFIKGLQEEKK